MSTIVDTFYQNYEELSKEIGKAENVSLQVWVNERFRRILVLTIANSLENEIQSLIRELVKKKTSCEPVNFFLSNSMERQFYTYFDFKSNNANRFFSLFGKRFKDEATADVDSDSKLKEGIASFLELIQTRNILMHENLHEVYIGDKTAREFYESYAKARIFLDYLIKKFDSLNY
jgi:hypothetical protein